MADSSSPPTVLAVDDEERFLDLYTEWLGDRYTVETATSGADALQALDASVDVVLLDRRMPGLSGTETLDAIRDRDIDPLVAMVTAVEPDVDVIEMAFDDYLVKPIDWETVRAVVERLLSLGTYDDAFREYYCLATKRAALEASVPDDELEASDRFATLCDDLDALEADLDAAWTAVADEDFPALLERRTGRGAD